MKSIICQNSPGILTDKDFHRAVFQGKGAATARRRRVLPVIKMMARIFPKVRLSISTYLDFNELIDTKEENRKIESHLVKEGFMNDPDFGKSYPLSAITSLLTTPPPNPLTQLKIPTMFLVPTRGWADPSYLRSLYNRLPDIKKKIVEVDGSVFLDGFSSKLCSRHNMWLV